MKYNRNKAIDGWPKALEASSKAGLCSLFTFNLQ